MKSGIALVVFVVVCTLSGQAVSAQTCGHGHAARPSGAVAQEQPPRPAPSVMAIAGLALLATGAATRRGAMERA
jgi:hypothetical protein